MKSEQSVKRIGDTANPVPTSSSKDVHAPLITTSFIKSIGFSDAYEYGKDSIPIILKIVNTK